MTNKKRTSFSLSEESLNLLKKLAALNDRSYASMVETLIKDAAKKAKIK